MNKLILADFQRIRSLALLIFVLVSGGVFTLRAQLPVTNDPPVYGPYNGVFLPDGDGLRKPLVEHDTVLLADSPWTLYAVGAASGSPDHTNAPGRARDD